MLAILNRCFPGGHATLVKLLRSTLELASLTDRARTVVGRHTSKANNVGENENVCLEAKLQELNLKSRDRKIDTRKTTKANAVALKTWSVAQLFFSWTTPAASAAGGVARGTGQTHYEVSSYDGSGRKHKRAEKEFTATMEPPRQKQRQRSKWKECLEGGVSFTFLVARKHEVKNEKKCREVQES